MGEGDSFDSDDLELQLALQMSMQDQENDSDDDALLLLDTMMAKSLSLMDDKDTLVVPGSPSRSRDTSSHNDYLMSRAQRSSSSHWKPKSETSGYDSAKEIGCDDLAKGWEQKLLARDSSTGLCTACSGIDIRSQYPMVHHVFHNLRESADRGCFICEFLLGNVKVEHSARSGEITVDPEHHKIHYKLPTDNGGCRATFELFTKDG